MVVDRVGPAQLITMASENRLSQVATTILARNVQALAASSTDELTAEARDRYIRPDIDQDAVFEEHLSIS